MAWTIIVICLMLVPFLISTRFGMVVSLVVGGLVAYVWLGNPELQTYKREHPEWARAHPNW